jgi:hypothetical protein
VNPLQPFIDKLHGLVPFFIVLIITGAILGVLVQAGENFLVRSIRSMLGIGSRKAKKPKAKKLSFDLEDAPHCPNCNRTMVRRAARRGVSAGEEFWGCAEYPNCRGTRPI